MEYRFVPPLPNICIPLFGTKSIIFPLSELNRIRLKEMKTKEQICFSFIIDLITNKMYENVLC